MISRLLPAWSLWRYSKQANHLSTRLDEFHEALRHDVVLLMVDVSSDCVEDVEALMRHRHPEAVAAGNSWTVDAFGV